MAMMSSQTGGLAPHNRPLWLSQLADHPLARALLRDQTQVKSPELGLVQHSKDQRNRRTSKAVIRHTTTSAIQMLLRQNHKHHQIFREIKGAQVLANSPKRVRYDFNHVSVETHVHEKKGSFEVSLHHSEHFNKYHQTWQVNSHPEGVEVTIPSCFELKSGLLDRLCNKDKKIYAGHEGLLQDLTSAASGRTAPFEPLHEAARHIKQAPGKLIQSLQRTLALPV